MTVVEGRDQAAAMPPVPASRDTSRWTWPQRYAVLIAITDLVVVAASIAGAQVLRFGLDAVDAARIEHSFELSLNYTLLSVLLAAIWFASLSITGTRDPRIVGTGSTEYRRIVDATFRVFGLVAIVVFLIKLDLVRTYILIALPAGLILLLVSRFLWRRWLVAQRRHGRYSYRVLLAGSDASVAAIARDLERDPKNGYHVVAAVTPTGDAGLAVPTTSDLDTIPERMAEHGADTLVLTSSDRLSPDRIRAISWGLEAGRQHLVMAPSLTDVGGPRIHSRPVSGLPLLHVETPRYRGAQAFTKRTFDLVVGLLSVVVLSPAFLVLAIGVKATSPGPVLYRSPRIGRGGRPFDMLKFRSMKVGAHEELADLLRQQGKDDRPLFKIDGDPRITRFGQFIRRYSLDELPQFFNVIGGSMSLVGPRPQMPEEVALYDDVAHRRLLRRPGITGLWQVSGRSNLPWEEAMRLDLYYIENWSLIGDIEILFRTIRVVLAKDGAV